MSHTAKHICLHPECAKKRADDSSYAEYARQDGLRDHVLRYHYGVIWRCKTCQLCFLTPQALSKHHNLNKDNEEHSNKRGWINCEEPIYCKKCDKWLSSQVFFELHIRLNCLFPYTWESTSGKLILMKSTFWKQELFSFNLQIKIWPPFEFHQNILQSRCQKGNFARK